MPVISRMQGTSNTHHSHTWSKTNTCGGVGQRRMPSAEPAAHLCNANSLCTKGCQTDVPWNSIASNSKLHSQSAVPIIRTNLFMYSHPFVYKCFQPGSKSGILLVIYLVLQLNKLGKIILSSFFFFLTLYQES